MFPYAVCSDGWDFLCVWRLCYNTLPILSPLPLINRVSLQYLVVMGGGLEGGIDTVTYRDFFVVDF